VIYLKLKSGDFFEFAMSSEEAEQKLVRKFTNKEVSPTAVLDLKDKGQHKVSDIEDLLFFVREKVAKDSHLDASEKHRKTSSEDLLRTLNSKYRQR
jgi:hypothetical protein